MPRRLVALLFLLLTGALARAAQQPPGTAAQPERVRAIAPPARPLPPEAESRDVTRFSFIAYGDTRGRHDGEEIQHEHSLVVDSMLSRMRQLEGTPSPVRFVLQSGDGSVNGRDPRHWNVSFTPIVDRLTKGAGVPYFMAPGNHDITSAQTVDAPDRQAGLRNYLDALSSLVPPDGSPRRLSGYPTYAFGYGNTFVLALDSNIAGDDRQYQWTKGQLEALDRTRYVNLVALFHHPVFSSGPHGGAVVEPQTAILRSRYMPLFHAHHVRMVIAGHDHLFEHWVERYADAAGPHRMDLVTTGGGGAPLYTYAGEPDLRDYARVNDALKVRMEHLVKPGVEPGSNPYHFTIVHVDGDRLDLEVVGVDAGTGFQPYRSNKIELRDPPR